MRMAGLITLLLVGSVARASGVPANPLRYEPELYEVTPALHPDTLLKPVRLLYCAAKGHCRAVARFPRGTRLLRRALSTSHRHVFVLYVRPDGRWVIDAYSTRGRGRTSRCAFPKGFEMSSSLNATFVATPGDNVYTGWGAGTYESEGALCRGRGGWGDAGSGPGLDSAPNRRYQVAYVPPGAPAADDQSIQVYNLAAGKALPASRAAKAGCSVTGLTWRPRAAVFACAPAKGRPARRLVIPLPHRAR